MALHYAPDERRPPAQDWNAKLHVVNGSPLAKPFPADRSFWAISGDGEAVFVKFWSAGSAWAQSTLFIEVDDISAAHAADDIMGWTDSQEDAEEAAELLAACLASAPSRRGAL